MKLTKLLKNHRLIGFVIVGVIIYIIYTNNLLSVLFPIKNDDDEDHDDDDDDHDDDDHDDDDDDDKKVLNITVENFEPKQVKYDTKEAKFNEAQLTKVQKTHCKDHKQGALYLKHSVSDVFDLDKTPEDLARWKKYVKKNHGGLPKVDKSSGEFFKNSCYPTLKYDGIHRI